MRLGNAPWICFYKKTVTKRRNSILFSNRAYLGIVVTRNSLNGNQMFQMTEARATILTEDVFRAVQEEREKRSNITFNDNGE